MARFFSPTTLKLSPRPLTGEPIFILLSSVYSHCRHIFFNSFEWFLDCFINFLILYSKNLNWLKDSLWLIFAKRICTEVQVVQPLTVLHTIFCQKRYSFRIPFIDKWHPFHIPCLELYIPFILNILLVFDTWLYINNFVNSFYHLRYP